MREFVFPMLSKKYAILLLANYYYEILADVAKRRE